ncbi:hypothetical protein VI817_000038 [Penicillium citrinum]|nr:hypothetical protein VI817_000038 [Penicillium citrinum]
MHTEFPIPGSTQYNDQVDTWSSSGNYPQAAKDFGIGLQSPVEEDSCFEPKNNLSRPSSHAHLRSSMQLNLELLTDLENLESISILLGSSCILAERPDRIISTVDLPIFRIISHSEWFLNIVTSHHVFPGTHLPGKSPITPEQQGSSPSENLCPPIEGLKRIEECFDTIPTTKGSDDGEYKKLSDVPSNSPGDDGLCAYNLSEPLSILAAYCQLIRVYHTLFNQLHRFFLMVPPDEAAGILSLPTIRFGKFHMTGHFTTKLQVLIELSFHMLGKIDHALGISEFMKGVLGEDLKFAAQHISYTTSISTSTSAIGSLGSLRDHVLTREHVMVVQSLKETMNFLKAFVKTIAVDGVP